MAEISDDKELNELNPFLSNLEGADLEDSTVDWGKLADDPADTKKIGNQTSFDSFSPASKKLFNSSGHTNKWALVLFLFFLSLAVIWVAKTKFFPTTTDSDFAEPEIDDNTIQLATVVPVEAEEEISPNKVQKIQVPASKVGRGEYYLALDLCAFNECINQYENILSQANLPIDKRENSQTFSLLRLISNDRYHTDEAAAYLAAVATLSTENATIDFIESSNGQGIISAGLFTTVQKAKETKELLEAIAAQQGKKISFKLTNVSTTQKVTHIYSGPFSDLNTANYIKTELSLTTPIKDAQITKLSKNN